MSRHLTFVDTNVLLYMFDPAHLVKRETAIETIERLGSDLCTSTQVLQEFYWAGTRKLKLEPLVARSFVHELANGQVIPSSGDLVVQAIDLAQETGYSLWDALILQAAVFGGCTRLLSEDMQHGQFVRNVRIENPFLSR